MEVYKFENKFQTLLCISVRSGIIATTPDGKVWLYKLKSCKTVFIHPVIACVVLSLMTSGCSAALSDNPSGAASATQEDAERVIIMGEITETIGNMITLNLIERTEATQMTDEELAGLRERYAGGGADGGGRTELSEEEQAAMLERFSQGRNESGQGRQMIIGEGETPEGFPEGFAERFAEGMPEGFAERFAVGMPGRARSYTGESKDIIIPAGAPILESSYSNGEQTESEISLDKLKAGDVIEVTYASDGETVAKVVKQSSTLSTGRIITDGSGNGGGFRAFPSGEGFAIPDGEGSNVSGSGTP